MGSASDPNCHRTTSISLYKYIDPRGELHWLVGWDELKDKYTISEPSGLSEVAKEQVTRLEAQAEKLGLEFPKGFFKFMSLVEEEVRVKRCGSYYFHVPDRGYQN